MTTRTLHTGAEVASGAGASVDTAGELASLLTLTTTAGTPVVTVEGSADGTTWAATSGILVSGAPARLYGLPRYLRASWVGAGTFSLTAVTRALFCSPDDVRATVRGIGDGGPLADVLDADLERHIEAASDEIVSAFQTAQFKLPVYAVGPAVQKRCADIACLNAMRAIGFNPEGIADDIIVKAHDDAMAWTRQIARERLRPAGVIDATPAAYDGGAAIAFAPRCRRDRCL